MASLRHCLADHCLDAPGRRRPERGFTLIEIMFVCAIIAVLAALVIPQFSEDSRKTKAKSEVEAFFAELGVRQEQFRVDNGAYLTTAQCPTTAPSSSEVTVTCATAGNPWCVTPTTCLNVRLPKTTAFCVYTITAGTGTGTTNPTFNSTTFTFTSPTGVWYHMRAECDLDGDGTKSTFFSSSVDSSIQTSANTAE